jgi:cell division FtsZ-interacting protein ZapD
MTPNEIYKAVAKMVRSNEPGTDRDKLILELHRRAGLKLSRAKLQGFYRTDPDDYRARRANLTDCQNLLTALLRSKTDKPAPMAPLTPEQLLAVRFMVVASRNHQARGPASVGVNP